MEEVAKKEGMLQLSCLPVAQAECGVLAVQTPCSCGVLEGVEEEERQLRDLQGTFAVRDEDILR